MGTLFPRICSWVRLADLDTARCFYVYNLHLDNLSQKSRSKSVRILAEQISFRKHPDPFIVMGDFNMELSNPAMMYLQQFKYKTPHPRLQDTWAAVYPYRLDEGTYHKFKGDPTGPKIDHILVGEGCRVLAAAIDRRTFHGLYPSDHFPVSAVVDLW
jgi:endonuclease/exonuclease/phosphatase family metal-dependent hydrolase